VTGLIVFLACFTIHLWLSLFFARQEYRRRYAKLSGWAVPAVYGRGWMTPPDKRDKALQSAYLMMVFWPVILSSRITRWMIMSAGKTDPYVIETIEQEIDQDRDQEDFADRCPSVRAVCRHGEFRHRCAVCTAPPETCPCGYTTECSIFCGGTDWACHQVAPFLDFTQLTQLHIKYGGRS
jgi:hypothetical protein